VGDLAEGILGAHELHHVRRGPHLYAQLAESTHAVVKLALIAAVGLDLARVAAHNDEVKLRADLEELSMLFMSIVNQLAAHPRRDHAIRKRN